MPVTSWQWASPHPFHCDLGSEESEPKPLTPIGKHCQQIVVDLKLIHSELRSL